MTIHMTIFMKITTTQRPLIPTYYTTFLFGLDHSQFIYFEIYPITLKHAELPHKNIMNNPIIFPGNMFNSKLFILHIFDKSMVLSWIQAQTISVPNRDALSKLVC